MSVTYAVDNVVAAGLKIDGKAVDLRAVPFGVIAIRDHYDYSLSTLDFVIADATTYFDRVPITDASVVEVFLSRRMSDPIGWTPFRVFSRHILKCSQLSQYTVSCYYDAPEYWKSRKTETFEMTSYDTVKNIAGMEGFAFEGDPTTDKMIWRNSFKARCQFLRQDVVPKGASDETSYFRLCFSHKLQGLKYRDLVKRLSSGSVATLSNYADPAADYVIVEVSPHDTFGKQNRSEGGYGTRSAVFDVTTGEKTLDQGVTVKKVLPWLQINKKLLNSDHPVVYEYHPLNLGNVPLKIQLGETKNNRVASTWSSRLDILVRDFTKIDVFDAVELRVVTDFREGTLDPEMSGKWVVIGKAKVGMYHHYVEKLCLIRSGTALQATELV